MKGTYQSDNDFLLSAVQRGDQKAFDTLFRRYYPMLCAYGQRFVELEDAEEIVEDSLLWIWENRETLVIESSLNSYLFKMVYRRALNKIAHIDATQRADTRFYEEMQEMLQDTDYYQIEELTKRIEDAVAALPESYREAFVMHRFRDMSYKEIAETLGVSPKTIDYRIQQALKQLRTDLKDYLPLLLLVSESIHRLVR
ncbi:RNA polymerase sigma-70 factor [Bacteroides acidifaciens]|uniref:RNA polymerase sigma-70 factor n=1 Tax=Bacteroides acidifaciens TaxID=85831 RepID=UPI00158AC9D3|nr:RNA polymerase sigma-70 factor [Bacteroides acidifaciens]MDE6821474.1 RNA polymerase sigma-70 factor [Bacteroides acidifaciens]